MNRWRTWRARLEHLLRPSGECLCQVCAGARKDDRIVAILGGQQKLKLPVEQPREGT